MTKKIIKATISDIAREAGVSKSTISFVVNKTKHVKPKTKKKVLDAIKKLKYTPNIIASSLKSKISKTIGFIIADYYNPVFAPIIKGIESIASKYDYSLILCESNFDIEAEEKIIENLKSRFVDGIILNTVSGDTSHVKKLQELNIPLVFLGCIKDPLGDIFYVCPDEYMGLYGATDYLIKNNHKNIIFITVEPDLYAKELRLKGYKDSLVKHNLIFNPEMVLTMKINTTKENHIASGDMKNGYNLAEKIFNSNLAFSAIICWSDSTALGILNYCKENNIDIPEEYSIVGWENLFFTPFLSTPLSTVNISKRKMGIKSAELLFGLINNTRIKDNHIILETNFIERKSVKSL